MTTALQQAFPGTTVSNATMIAKLAEQGIIVVDDLDAVVSEDFSLQPWAGICARADGALFMYDPTDTTSAHDGSTVIVVSGRRYILQTQVIPDYFVASQGDETPPGSPSFGDQYVIGAAPTGDWASKAKNIATWTARGWVFIPPKPGMLVWVNDENTYYHCSAAEIWTQGIAVSGISDGSITPLKLRHPLALLTIEDVRNAPPGSIPTDGTAYVVDTSPTGAFAGEAGSVAYVDNGAYVFIDPFEGATVYDKNQSADICYRSGAWERKTPQSRVPKIYRMNPGDKSLGTVAVAGTATYESLEVQGVAAGNIWRIDVDYMTTGSTFLVLYIFLDGESSARATFNLVGLAGGSYPFEANNDGLATFYIDVPDGSPHTLHFRIFSNAGTPAASGTTNIRAFVTELNID